jgi:hypothetical protein
MPTDRREREHGLIALGAPPGRNARHAGPAAEEPELLPALVAIVLAPIAGWVSMVACWAIVDTEGRGGIDIGVVLIGTAIATLLTALVVRYSRLQPALAVAFTLATLAITFAVSFLVVWFFFTGFGAGWPNTGRGTFD